MSCGNQVLWREEGFKFKGLDHDDEGHKHTPHKVFVTIFGGKVMKFDKGARITSFER